MGNNARAETSILFVDNEEAIQKSFTKDLQMEHFAVTAVANSSEAISALEGRQYDLVITDLMIPGVDGFGVLRVAKKLAPQTSVIILTDNGDMQSAIDALRLGADDFVRKPCKIEELLLRIRHCLEKRSLLLESKQTRKELRESENIYRRLIEITGTGFVILDDQGCVIDANLEYAQLSGRKKVEDVLGHSVLE